MNEGRRLQSALWASGVGEPLERLPRWTRLHCDVGARGDIVPGTLALPLGCGLHTAAVAVFAVAYRRTVMGFKRLPFAWPCSLLHWVPMPSPTHDVGRAARDGSGPEVAASPVWVLAGMMDRLGPGICHCAVVAQVARAPKGLGFDAQSGAGT